MITSIIIRITASKLLLVAMILFPLLGSSQNQRIDSLNSVLSEKSGLEYCEVLYELALENFMLGRYDQTIKYVEKAFPIARQIGDSLNIVKTIAIKASALRRLENIDSAMYLYNKILPIAKRNNYDDEVKNISNSVGVIYTYEAHYDRALKYFFASLDIREKQGNKLDISVALLNIGLVYYKLRDWDTALSYYSRSLQLKREIKSTYDLDILLNNISLCYIYKGNFFKARDFIDQGFLLCNKNCSEFFLLSAFYTLGLIAYEQKNYPDAEVEFLKSYKLAKKTDNIRFQLENIICLSEIYILRNQLNPAEKYLIEAATVMKNDSRYNREFMGIYTQFTRLYDKSRNFEKVAFYQKKYIALKDSIFNEEMTTNLMKAEAGYLERENKVKIESQNKILALNGELIFRQKIANASIALIALLVVGLAFVLARSNRQKRIANRLLDEKVNERTRELKLNADALQRAWQERDALIYKASNDIKSSIATIKGLCFLGIKDIDHPNAYRYLNKLDTTSDHLSDIISKMFYSYKIDTPSK